MAETGHKPLRLAIASDSCDRIDACFGQVREFQIYEAADDGYRLLEIRPGISEFRDKNHDPEALYQAACLLRDCELVLAGRIGPGAITALSDQGITGLAVDLSINEALARLSANLEHGQT